MSWLLHWRGTDLRTMLDETVETAFVQAAMDVKRGICPIIQIEHEDF